MTKRLTTIFGVILLLLGVLGFVSNPLIGTDALFAADGTHNLMHAVLGAVLLGIVSWYPTSPSLGLRLIGGLLIILGIIGLVSVPTLGGTLLGIFYTNGAYNWLHIALGASMLFASEYEN